MPKEDRKARELVVCAQSGGGHDPSRAKGTLVEAGDKVEEDEKSRIESAIVELEEANSGEDVEAIQNKTTTLMEASHKLAEKMYQEPAALRLDSAEPGG
ncbi:MAG: hypothetical protein Ct9H300mP13_0720 [Gammaproteobacteria bacterium]|nr:MAG: hypothetical protein Ct9H300mP13_0720 [Gammaproteobacteria bacterium]